MTKLLKNLTENVSLKISKKKTCRVKVARKQVNRQTLDDFFLTNYSLLVTDTKLKSRNEIISLGKSFVNWYQYIVSKKYGYQGFDEFMIVNNLNEKLKKKISCKWNINSVLDYYEKNKTKIHTTSVKEFTKQEKMWYFQARRFLNFSLVQARSSDKYERNKMIFIKYLNENDDLVKVIKKRRRLISTRLLTQKYKDGCIPKEIISAFWRIKSMKLEKQLRLDINSGLL